MRKKIRTMCTWLVVMLACFMAVPTGSLAAESETGKETAVTEEAALEENKAASSEEKDSADGTEINMDALDPFTEFAESSTRDKVIFVVVMIVMLVAPIILFFILLFIFSRLQEFIMKKTGKIPGGKNGKQQKPKKK